MADFTTRVELHEATWSDYQTLHGQMEAAGFQRTIHADQGAEYHLPTAEYVIAGNLTASDALEKAKVAAATTRKRFAVFVTTATAWRWYGLPAA